MPPAHLSPPRPIRTPRPTPPILTPSCPSCTLAQLERIIRALQTGQPLPAGVAMPHMEGGAEFDEWREDLIAKAEGELKAAMSAGDPERLKAAIANASDTVAKARAKGSHVLKKQQVLHGDGLAATSRATEHIPTEADALTEEEKEYVRFHEIATARKLALASRGFEVQNVFIDTLYDAAINADVPHGEWGEFVRLQLPSPRTEGDEAPEADCTEMVEEEVVEEGGASKVKKAMRKAAKIIGWRANFAKIAGVELATAAPLMERPDDMPIADGAADWYEAGMAGASVHVAASSATSNVADVHLGLLSMADAGTGPLTPGGSPSRAQRYNAKLRERMDARDQARKDGSPRV